MMIVCSRHVKNGLKVLNVPHIKKLNAKNKKKSCFFCDELAEYCLFYDLPFEKKLSKTLLNSNRLSLERKSHLILLKINRSKQMNPIKK